MKALKLTVSALCLLLLSACGSISKISMPGSVQEIILSEYNGSPANTYNNADKPVKVRATYTQDNGTEKENLLRNPSLVTQFAFSTQYTYTPEINIFAKSAAESYLDRMGFEVTSAADYVLQIDIKTFSFSKADKQNTNYQVSLSYALLNEAGEMIVPTNASNGYVTLSNSIPSGEGLGRAYFEALQKINWDRIAKPLTVQKSAKKEKNAKVRGNGDTALEHTVIRWNIMSRPQGADVSWRVISSTPDVQNTNSNYVGSTPYESTESFDIKGLTYNNSGNVQIEVTCERPGYLSQKKRFNLRQAIDQKEISAMFNLIKDDE